MLLPLATVLGLTGCSYVLGPAVWERHTLPATIDDVYGSPNSHIMRTHPNGFGARDGRPTSLGHCDTRDYKLLPSEHKRREIPLYSTILEYL
jgi:hypothetical protein